MKDLVKWQNWEKKIKDQRLKIKTEVRRQETDSHPRKGCQKLVVVVFLSLCGYVDNLLFYSRIYIMKWCG